MRSGSIEAQIESIRTEGKDSRLEHAQHTGDQGEGWWRAVATDPRLMLELPATIAALD
ncbi:MAG TPA: hypothetical protein VMS99_00945 [Acidimicrobiia bacterium]|nr:hypothetical protein [Acidimicrobiia bacterium]